MSHKEAKKLSAKITTEQKERPQAVQKRSHTVNLGIDTEVRRSVAKSRMEENKKVNIPGKNKNM